MTATCSSRAGGAPAADRHYVIRARLLTNRRACWQTGAPANKPALLLTNRRFGLQTGASDYFPQRCIACFSRPLLVFGVGRVFSGNSQRCSFRGETIGPNKGPGLDDLNGPFRISVGGVVAFA